MARITPEIAYTAQWNREQRNAAKRYATPGNPFVTAVLFSSAVMAARVREAFDENWDEKNIKPLILAPGDTVPAGLTIRAIATVGPVQPNAWTLSIHARCHKSCGRVTRWRNLVPPGAVGKQTRRKVETPIDPARSITPPEPAADDIDPGDVEVAGSSPE